MVYKEMFFDEYTLNEEKNQWAVITIGKGENKTEMFIDYNKRVVSDDEINLYMNGKRVFKSEVKGFDSITAHIERNLVIFYTKETGHNVVSFCHRVWQGN